MSRWSARANQIFFGARGETSAEKATGVGEAISKRVSDYLHRTQRPWFRIGGPGGGTPRLFQKKCHSREELLHFLIVYSAKKQLPGLFGWRSSLGEWLDVTFTGTDGGDYNLRVKLETECLLRRNTREMRTTRAARTMRYLLPSGRKTFSFVGKVRAQKE